MKKSLTSFSPTRKRLLKLLIMRTTIIILLLCSANVYANITYGQNTKISLKVRDVSFQEAVNVLQNESDYYFFYKSEDIPANMTVTANLKNADIIEVMGVLLKNSALSYKIVDKYIAILKKTEAAKIELPQQKKISGTVKDDKGITLPGVSVIVKGTTIGTVTNIEGFYTLEIPESATTLVFSYIGMKTLEVEINGLDIIDAVLEQQGVNLDEIVVVGYGTVKKKDITTAVASVRAKDLESQNVSNLSEALVGKMAGVQVTQSTGKPGNTLDFKVRGVGTITAGNSPLYVVDGMPLSAGTLSTLNSSDIETIEVLKDASSASIYGSRGSNGVVIITTKQGKNQKATISYSGTTGVQSIAKKIDMMDAYQYANIARDARNNTYSDAMQSINKKLVATGKTPIAYSLTDENGVRLANTGNNTNTIIPSEILPYLQNQSGLTNTDWQDQIYRSALMQNHTISATGGSANMNYYTSLEYFGQDGIVINSDFKRYGAKLNLNGSRGIFKFGVNLNPTHTKENIVNTDGAYSNGGVVASALHYSPIFPVYNADGSYSFNQNSWSSDTKTTLPNASVVTGNAQTQAWNPVALAMLTKDQANLTRLLSSVYLEAAILEVLKYKISYGMDISNRTEDFFRPSSIPLSNTAGNPPSIATGWSKYANELNWVLEQTLNYNKKIGNHSLDALAGWTLQKDKITSNYVYAGKGYISDQITTVSGGIVTDGNSRASEFSLASGLARVQYNYSGKYLLSAAIRADGSSRFGTDNKWGYFPSVSAGWRISQENFMKSAKWISDLKLRFSYGLTGNFNIPNYGAQGTVSYYSYILGNTTPSAINGAAPSSQPNSALSWEKTKQANIGFDFSILKNALVLSVDAYNGNTYDLLLNVPVPISTGYTSELKNIGKVNNKGIELNLTSNQTFGKFVWQANLNYSKNINEVKELGPGNADIITSGSVANAYFLTRVGEPIGSYYLPVVLGVFKTQAEVDAYPHYIDAPANYDLATTKPGDFKFKDSDGNGVIDLTKDREIVGNYMPKFMYGFSSSLSYSNFDLGIALQGVYGNKILNLSRRYFDNHEGNMNNYAAADNYWRSETDPGSGWDVRANRVSKGQNGTTSTWNIEDGSYLRIRNISLGYTIPESLAKRINVTNAKIYVSIQNPVTFTNYSGYNPEVSNRSEVTTNGEDYGVYPVSRTFSIGLNFTL